ncbi:MAG: histidine phosphatase family protein [Ruminococcaceae bacterium]|nr:histidine phosphatase family protein [Oscillospiraceae bacterium]
MVLYIIRHADPDYSIDSLTEFGWQEAEALGDRMAGSRLDRIYTSPLGRAIATAEPTCRKTGLTSSVEPWMSESIDYMRFPDFATEANRHTGFQFSFDKGITEVTDYFAELDRSEYLAKMISASDEFLARHGYVREGGLYRIAERNSLRIACFCHGGFGSAWIGHLMGLPAAYGWLKFAVRTTSVTKLAFNDYHGSGYAQVTAEYIGDTSHVFFHGLRNNNR